MVCLLTLEKLQLDVLLSMKQQGLCFSKRIRRRCRNLRSFAAEGNEKADELAKASAMLDEGFEKRCVHAFLQYAASFRCLAEEWKDCGEL